MVMVGEVERSTGGRPNSLKHVAYERFQQVLLNGVLRPGQFVSQRDLVSILGMSLGALRELLPRLESENLVTVVPQRGIQITVITLPMIHDAFQFRTALEREAVLTAVRRMHDDVLHEQRRIHQHVLARAGEKDSGDLYGTSQDIDTNFHKLFIDSTENELLIQSYAVNSIRIRLINLDRIRLSPASLEGAFGDHLDIIDAVMARDGDRACRAVEKHMHNARQRAVEF